MERKLANVSVNNGWKKGMRGCGISIKIKMKLIKQHMDWITNQKHVYPLKELVNGDCQHVAMETLTVELHHLIPYPIHSWLLVVVQRPWSLDGKPVVQLSREKWGNSVDQHCANELRLQTKLFSINYKDTHSDDASSAGKLANSVNLHTGNRKARKDTNPSWNLGGQFVSIALICQTGSWMHI